MEIVFDPAKDAINQKKHGCSLADAGRFDWGSLRYKRLTRSTSILSGRTRTAT
ncbi:MAG: hypothetical protein VB141_11075 [Burkholderia gladioli]